MAHVALVIVTFLTLLYPQFATSLFCENAQLVNITVGVAPSTISSNIATGCTLRNSSKLTFSGVNIPMLPTAGTVEMEFVNGVMSDDCLIHIIGPTSATASSLVPMVVLISNNSIVQGSAILVTGSFPPNSNITVSFNNIISTLFCIQMKTVVYNEFLTVIAIADIVPIVLYENAAINVQYNYIEINATGPWHSVPFVFNAITFNTNSATSINWNTIISHGATPSAYNTWVFLYDTPKFYVTGTQAVSQFIYVGGGGRWEINDNWIQLSSLSVSLDTILADAPGIPEAPNGGTFSICRNYFRVNSYNPNPIRVYSGEIGIRFNNFSFKFDGNIFDMHQTGYTLLLTSGSMYGASEFSFSDNTFISHAIVPSVQFSNLHMYNSSRFSVNRNTFKSTEGATLYDSIVFQTAVVFTQSTTLSLVGNSLASPIPNRSLFSLLTGAVIAPTANVLFCGNRYFGTRVNKYTYSVAVNPLFQTLPLVHCDTMTLRNSRSNSSERSMSATLLLTQSNSLNQTSSRTVDPNSLSNSDPHSNTLLRSYSSSAVHSTSRTQEYSTSRPTAQLSTSATQDRSDSISAPRSVSANELLSSTSEVETSGTSEVSRSSSLGKSQISNKYSNSVSIEAVASSTFVSAPQITAVVTSSITKTKPTAQLSTSATQDRSDTISVPRSVSADKLLSSSSQLETSVTSEVASSSSLGKSQIFHKWSNTVSRKLATSRTIIPGISTVVTPLFTTRRPTRGTTTAIATSQPTATETPAANTTRPPVQLNLMPLALSTVGYGYRYIEYNPVTPIYGLVSGLSLLYTETYKSYFTRRFLIPSTSTNTQVRHLLAASLTSNASTSLLGISKCSTAFTSYSLNGDPLFDFAEQALNATGYATDYRSFACGDEMNGYPSDINVDRTVSTVLLGSGLGGFLVATMSASTNGACRSAIRHGGSIYSYLPYRSGPLLSYVYLSTDILEPQSPETFVDKLWKGRNDSVIFASGFETIASYADAIFVGDASNPKLLPTPAKLKKLSLLIPNTALVPTEPNIGNTTHNAVACTVADQKSFSATFIPVNTTIASNLGATVFTSGQATGCFTFDTVDDLHLACQLSLACVGFTTIRMAGPKELPLCMYENGIPANDQLKYPRVFYGKPQASSLPICSVNVQLAGRVAVYIQQTDLAQNFVVVKVNGNVATKCGGSSVFSNGFNGVAGRCNQWALCFVEEVPANSVISVTSNTFLDQSGCDNSLGVIVEQLTVTENVTVQTTVAPIPKLNVSDMTVREVSKASSHSDPIRVFVYRGETAALDVMQTGYACATAPCQYESAIEFRAGASCQRCGGTTGFYRGRSGRSDQCEDGQFCGNTLSMAGLLTSSSLCTASSSPSASLDYTGMAQMAINMSALAFPAGLCSRFHAKLYVLPSSLLQANNRLVPLFPLVDPSSSSAFRTLLAVPSNTPLVNVATMLGLPPPTELSSVAERILSFSAGPKASLVDFYYVNWDSLGDVPQTMLNSSSTQACLVDHSQELATICTFYIPKGSTTIKVEAAQTDFATKQMTVTTMRDRKTVTSSTVCGGSSNPFGFSRGQQEQCGTYSTCVDQYLYTEDNQADSNTEGLVTVSLPPQLRSYGCNFTASILVTFGRPSSDVAIVCSEYECPNERRCIPFSSVCDSVQDCASNADERTCRPLAYLPTETFCVESAYVLVFQDMTFEECRRKAVANGSTIFALSDNVCTVVASTAVATLMANPSLYVCIDPNVVSYLYLPDRWAFGLCRDTIQCYGHGTARLSRSGECQCTCRQGYYGASCENALKLDKITDVSCILEPVTDARVLNFKTIAEILSIGSQLVVVSCLSAALQSADSLRVDCSLTSLLGRDTDTYTHYRRLLETESWPQINSSLRAVGFPGLQYVSARTIMSPITDYQACEEILDNTSSSPVASCSLNTQFDRLSLVVRNSLPALSVSVAVGENSSSSGSSSSSRESTLSCATAYVDGTGGCVVSTCDLDITGTDGKETIINATSIVLGDTTLLTSGCASASIGLSPKMSIGNQQTTTTETTENKRTNFAPYLIGGILAFIVGALLAWLVASYFQRRHILQYQQMFLDYLPSGEADLGTQLMRIKTHMLVYLAFIKEGNTVNMPHNSQLATILMLFGFVCAILASVLVVFYSTAFELNSNFSVMYEEYTDYLCDQSPTANIPRRIFSVAAGTQSCDRVSATGEQVGQTFAFGECSGSDGSYTATFKMASSLNTCRDARKTSVPSGSCIPLSDVDPSGSTRNVFVRLTCSTSSLISQRQTVLKQLTSQADVFVKTDISKVPPKLVSSADASGSPPFRTPFLASSVLKVSSSNTIGVLASQATTSDFDGDLNTQRLVLQVSRCTFSDDSDSSCVEPIEALIGTNLSSPQADALLPFAPATPDIPIGHLFGGFGTSGAETWISAGPQAHRYFGIEGTSFDLGRHFPAVEGSLSDDDGYAISLWLRADSTTLGFAYVVTDAFENVDTQQIYPVERLAAIIDAGGGVGDQWFNETYSVYHGLYVNGPGKTLIFAYASPHMSGGTDSSLTLLEFDLQVIGAARVVNGQWHHIAVTFISENSQVRAQLVVDGQTSYTKPGWSNCAKTLPKAVTSFGLKVPVFSPQSDRIYNGGLLAIGYFNGGVYRLQAHTGGPTMNTDLLPTGTLAMRDGNPFERSSTLTLGAIMVVIAGVLLIWVLVWGARELHAATNDASVEEYKSVSKVFYDLQSRLIVAREAKSDEREEGNDSEPFEPICLHTALRWVEVSPSVFRELMAAISAGHPSQDASAQVFCLFLYQCLTQNVDTKSFSIRHWNAEAKEDQQSLNNAPQKLFGDVELSDAQKDSAKCGGIDYFQLYFNAHEEFGTFEKSNSVHADKEKHDVDHTGVGTGVGKGISSVDVKALGLSGGGSAAGGSGSSSCLAVVGSVLSVFQGMHVWATSIELPSVYNQYFSGLFSFVSIDFTSTVPSLPTIVTPLIQVLVGLIVLCLVVYFVVDDSRAFDTNFAAYVWRRDELEVSVAADSALRNKLPKDLTNIHVDTKVAEGTEAIPIMALKNDNIRPESAYREDSGRPIDGEEEEEEEEEEEKVKVKTDAKGENPEGLVLGVRCPQHNVRLTVQVQTTVWPYFNRPSCCVSTNSHLCGESVGMIYSCGFEHTDSEGDRKVCNYALCDSHCRQSVLDLIVIAFLSPLRQLKNNGLVWIGCVALVAAAGAAYTPFIKTALMIVGCHPYYQCEFENCWTYIDQKFALAAFLSITVLILFGLGYPAALFLILRRRKAALESTFNCIEYQDTYAETGHVKSEEWKRFVLTDSSALSGQYRDLNYKWIYFQPILVLMKILPLLPAVLMEPRTFEQRLACAMIEIATTIFLFSIKFYQSPLVMISIRISQVHQVLLLGLQNLDLVVRNDGDGDLSIAMVIATFVYLAISVILFGAVLLYPVFDMKIRTFYLQRILNKHGIEFASDGPIYRLPNTGVDEKELVPLSLSSSMMLPPIENKNCINIVEEQEIIQLGKPASEDRTINHNDIASLTIQYSPVMSPTENDDMKHPLYIK